MFEIFSETCFKKFNKIGWKLKEKYFCKCLKNHEYLSRMSASHISNFKSPNMTNMNFRDEGMLKTSNFDQQYLCHEFFWFWDVEICFQKCWDFCSKKFRDFQIFKNFKIFFNFCRYFRIFEIFIFSAQKKKTRRIDCTYLEYCKCFTLGHTYVWK